MNIQSEISEIVEKLHRNWETLRKMQIDEEIKSAKYICVFGTGDWYNWAVHNYEPFISGRLDFVCDNNPDKWGTTFDGAKCLSPDELKELGDDVFVFVAIKDPKPIFSQLQEMGIRHMNIINPWRNQNYEPNVFEDRSWLDSLEEELLKTAELFEDEFSLETFFKVLKTRYSVYPEYEDYSDIMVTKGDDYFFDTPIGPMISSNESYIDVGAYDGDSLFAFIEKVRGEFHRADCFELDIINYKTLLKEIDKMDEGVKTKVNLYNFGLSDKNGIVKYLPCRSLTKVVTESNVSVEEGQVKVLDELLAEKSVTLIKMDVEGMETEVLKGSRNIIKTQKPKLAISAYHKNSDIWLLPQLIHEMNPEYKFYLRHQACINASTILYCI